MVDWIAIAFGIPIVSAAVSLLMLRKLLRPEVFFCNCPPPSRPRRAVITGATSGIGLATAHELARRGWSLILGCRDTVSGAAVKQCLVEKYNPNVELHYLDLTDLSSIPQFVENISSGDPIDVLINNAGIMAGRRDIFPSLRLDSNMLTNFIGPFCLFQEVLSYIRMGHSSFAPIPRIIFVSSSLGARGSLNLQSGTTLEPLPSDKWNPRSSYENSKQALNLSTREIARRFGMGENHLLNVYTVVTGGMVNTNLDRDFIGDLPFLARWLLQGLSRLVLKTPQEGCQSVIHCAISENVYGAHLGDTKDEENQGSGCLYRNCLPIEWPESANCAKLAAAVYEEAECIYRNIEK